MRITYDNRTSRTVTVLVGREPTVIRRPTRANPCVDDRARTLISTRDADALTSVAAHSIIAELIAGGRRDPGLMEITVTTRRWFDNHPVLGRRGVVEDRCSQAVCCYFRRFVPPSEVVFAGSEVTLVGGGRVDLLWRRPDGVHVVDEVKLIAPSDHGTWGADINDQIDRYLREGQRQFAAAFAGVRLLALNGHNASEWRTATGVARLREVDVWTHGIEGALR